MKIKDILGEDGEVTMKPIQGAQEVDVDGKPVGMASTPQAAATLSDLAKKGEITLNNPNAPAGTSTTTPEDYEDEEDPDLVSGGNHDVSNDGTDKFIDDVRDAASERAMGYGPEQHDHTHPEMEEEGFLGLGNKTPEEWAKTSKQMATLLQFQAKYQGTPYADQVAKRIALLKDRLDLESGEVAGQGGAPKPVVPPEQFDMKQLKEADDALLEKMRAIAGLR